MTTIMSLPRQQRPWGIATWLSEVFVLCRPSLYALTRRVQHRLLPKAAPPALPDAAKQAVGWISELLMAAGQQAGHVLAGVDTQPLGVVIAARDETFFQGQPLLLVIDPVTTVILLAQVTDDRQADQQQAPEAAGAFHLLVADDNQRQHLAEQLLALLDAACRASSMMEGVNRLLKQFRHNHQAFRSPEALQLYLNLFVLWHNMRVFERGKRQGKSPYQLAGIDPGADDWLTLFGYPAG